MVGVAAPRTTVRLISETIIKAPDGITNSHSDHVLLLPLSNFDRLMGGLPVTLFYAYRKPSVGAAGDYASIVSAVKASLAAALAHSLPFAGQIAHDPESGEAVNILCNNRGVMLLEASANVSLATLDFHDLNESMRKVLLPFPHDFPLSVQVTGYSCGGFSIACNFDHLLADGSGFIRFLASWTELAKTATTSNQISAGGLLLDHDRSVFPPRSTPSYGPLLDKTYTVFNPDQIAKMPPNGITLKRLYCVHGSSIDRLRAEASSEHRRSRTEALSAHLLKLMAGTVLDESSTCKMAMLVDGRAKLGVASSYVGNVLSVAIAEASATKLKNGSLTEVAGLVSEAVREVGKRDHFVELNDWVECHRPGPMGWEFMIGRSKGPVLLVSSCHNMPVMSSADFGFGTPTLGFFYPSTKTITVGYVNMVSTGRGDGSWFVSTFIWPRLAAALESDPRRVFQAVDAGSI